MSVYEKIKKSDAPDNDGTTAVPDESVDAAAPKPDEADNFVSETADDPDVSENPVPEAGASEAFTGKPAPAPASKPFAADFFEFFEMFVISAIIVTILFSFCMRLCKVVGQSMESTLFEGETLVVSDLFYKPACGDIIVFHHTSEEYPSLNEPIVKRVIATGGEYVSIDVGENTLTVTVYDSNMQNPRVLDEDYTQYVDRFVTGSIHDYPVQVPEGYLFVMGDNRNHSTDSRSSLISFVDERCVLGKVILRLTPFSKIGSVN